MKACADQMAVLDHRAKAELHALRDAIRLRRYSIRTEEAYVGWVRRFFNHNGGRHGSALSVSHIRSFLSYLALEANVAASTQNQALNALCFFYREVLEQPMDGLLEDLPLAKQARRGCLLCSHRERSVPCCPISQMCIGYWVL